MIRCCRYWPRFKVQWVFLFFWSQTDVVGLVSIISGPEMWPKEPAEEMKQDENIEINQRLGMVRKSPYNQSDLHGFHGGFFYWWLHYVRGIKRWWEISSLVEESISTWMKVPKVSGLLKYRPSVQPDDFDSTNRSDQVTTILVSDLWLWWKSFSALNG